MLGCLAPMTQLPLATPVPDLIDGILPAHECSILAGASGAGKTYLLMELVRAIQAGEDTFLGHRFAQTLPSVGYICADRTWAEKIVTATKVGADPNLIKVRSITDDPLINERRLQTGGMDLLFELMESLLPCDLILVDPMVIFFDSSIKEYHLMGIPLITIGKWCRQRNVTVLGTHHSTKARTDFTFKRPQDRISGSQALLGFSSAQLFLMEPEEGGPPHHQFYVNSHTAAPTTIALKRGENGVFSLVGEYAPMPEAEGLDPVAVAILESLPPEGAGYAVGREFILQRVRNVSAPTVDRRLRDLVASGRAARVGRGEYQRRS